MFNDGFFNIKSILTYISKIYYFKITKEYLIAGIPPKKRYSQEQHRLRHQLHLSLLNNMQPHIQNFVPLLEQFPLNPGVKEFCYLPQKDAVERRYKNREFEPLVIKYNKLVYNFESILSSRAYFSYYRVLHDFYNKKHNYWENQYSHRYNLKILTEMNQFDFTDEYYRVCQCNARTGGSLGFVCLFDKFAHRSAYRKRDNKEDYVDIDKVEHNRNLYVISEDTDNDILHNSTAKNECDNFSYISKSMRSQYKRYQELSSDNLFYDKHIRYFIKSCLNYEIINPNNSFKYLHFKIHELCTRNIRCPRCLHPNIFQLNQIYSKYSSNGQNLFSILSLDTDFVKDILHLNVIQVENNSQYLVPVGRGTKKGLLIVIYKPYGNIIFSVSGKVLRDEYKVQLHSNIDILSTKDDAVFFVINPRRNVVLIKEEDFTKLEFQKTFYMYFVNKVSNYDQNYISCNYILDF